MSGHTPLRKITIGIGAIAALVLAILGFNTMTAQNVKRRVEDTATITQLRYHVDQLMIWETDYTLTYRTQSQEKMHEAAENIKKTLSELRAMHKAQPSILIKLDHIETLYNDFQTQGSRMAEAYINFDRVVGNSFISDYHSTAEQLEKNVADLITISNQGTTRALNRSIMVSMIAAVVIALITIVPSYWLTTATVSRVRVLLDFLDR